MPGKIGKYTVEKELGQDGCLGYAHSKGVVHRDVKPENIMLLSDDTVKIMDWRDALRTVSVACRMGGWFPYFEAHLGSGSRFLIESHFRRCHLLMAQSIEMQPIVRGLIASSWFYSNETIEITPHLAWMRNFYLANGAVLVHLGSAAGFLQGSAKRRATMGEPIGREMP